MNIVKNITNLLHKPTNMCLFIFFFRRIYVSIITTRKKNQLFIFNGIEVVLITSIVMSIYNIFVLVL